MNALSLSTGINKGYTVQRGPKLDISAGLAVGAAIGAKCFGAGLLASTGLGVLVAAGLIKWWVGVSSFDTVDTNGTIIATPSKSTTTDPSLLQLQADLDAMTGQ